MAYPTEEDKFFSNLQEFFGLIESIVEELFTKQKTTFHPNLVKLAKQHLEKKPKNSLLELFASSSHVYWDAIRKRDESFLMDNVDSVFGSDPVVKEHIQPIKQIFIESLVVEEDKQIIWKFLDVFIKISIKYIHRMRGGMDDGSGPNYLIEFMNQVDLAHHASNWNLTLVFEKIKAI